EDLEPWFVDGELPTGKLLYLLLVNVDADYMVAHLGEARAGDEPHIAGAYDGYAQFRISQVGGFLCVAVTGQRVSGPYVTGARRPSHGDGVVARGMFVTRPNGAALVEVASADPLAEMRNQNGTKSGPYADLRRNRRMSLSS